MIGTPFGRFATAVVAWEMAALATERLPVRVPYITDIVRSLPRSGRVAFVAGVSIVLLEHLERMAMTNYCRQRLTRPPAHLGRGPSALTEEPLWTKPF